MKCFPNCKINIGLSVVSKRLDGYHNIESVFYPIPLCDELEIVESESFCFSQKGIVLDCNAEKNLCVKAYNLLKKDFPQIGNVNISLTKNIPSGAGLGGGSSDAAFTLRILNKIFSLGLSTKQLQSYAMNLGADCAIFIKNKPVFACERGDVFLDTFVNIEAYRLLLVKPDVGVSTAEAYAGIKPQMASFDLKKLQSDDIYRWKNYVTNDFETSVFKKLPILGDIKREIYEYGAIYAAMSGSGSTIYGIFEKNKDLYEANKYFTKKYFTRVIEF